MSTQPLHVAKPAGTLDADAPIGAGGQPSGAGHLNGGGHAALAAIAGERSPARHPSDVTAADVVRVLRDGTDITPDAGDLGAELDRVIRRLLP